MRCREWYGWHFPELGKIITDNLMYCKCVRKVGECWGQPSLGHASEQGLSGTGVRATHCSSPWAMLPSAAGQMGPAEKEGDVCIWMLVQFAIWKLKWKLMPHHQPVLLDHQHILESQLVSRPVWKLAPKKQMYREVLPVSGCSGRWQLLELFIRAGRMTSIFWTLASPLGLTCFVLMIDFFFFFSCFFVIMKFAVQREVCGFKNPFFPPVAETIK